jgi:aryl-alcohol dehydrogenase-like predicted oxidoreductase
VGRIGFGGYRVDDETPGHREALVAALEAGCTLIDTSTNYTDGRSERLIGSVLGELAARDPARRATVTVVSKIGYVQGQNLALAHERERSGSPFPEMVRYMEGCWHCIHPEFLKDQLGRSRHRLSVQRLDVCLLHNPEYYLTDARKHGHGADLDATRAEFYRRIQEAFAFLEERVRMGEIGAYGVSSNSAVLPPGDPEATSVRRMMQAAVAAGGKKHHFKVLQIPMNLFESGGALQRNTGSEEGETALEAAASAGLAVLINRPLNAFVDGRLVRVADVPLPPPGPPLEATRAALAALLSEHRERFAAALPPEGAEAADQMEQLVEQVAALAEEIDDHQHWEQIARQYVIPRVNMLIGALARSIPREQEAAWRDWWSRCLPRLDDLTAEVGRRAAVAGAGTPRSIAALIDPHLPETRRRESLSRKAVWLLSSTPGVSCVLVGMRRSEYVEDAMAVSGWEPHPDPLAIFRAVRAAPQLSKAP